MAGLNIDPSLLEEYALESGVTLHRPDGTVFNAAKRSGVHRLPKRAEPAPPPQEDGSAKLTAAIADMVSKLQPQVQEPPVVNVPPAQVIVQSQPRTAWEFQFVRNPDGTIKSIKAIPTKE